MKAKRTITPNLKPYDLSESNGHVTKYEFQNPHYSNAYDLSKHSSSKQKCIRESHY